MSKAIITKFHGPTSNRCAKYSARDSDGNRVFISTNYEIGRHERHTAAAVALCRKMKWTGHIINGGGLKGEEVFVFLPHDLELAHSKRGPASEIINVDGKCAVCAELEGK